MVTQNDKHGACARLVREHAASVANGEIPDITGQLAQHVKAWNHPFKGGERAVKLAIEGFAAYADDYYDSFETEVGGDGYFGGHARNLLRAINASLTMGFKSRLDSGSVHRLLLELARTAGIKGDI